MSVPIISSQQFEREVLCSEVPVLVDFCDERDESSRIMVPVVDRLAADVAGKARVVKVDTSAEPRLAAAFHISTVPAFYIINHGLVVDGSIGVTPAEQLRDMVDHVVEDRVEANE